MPRRNHRQANYEPLDLTPADVKVSPRRPTGIRSPYQVRDERIVRENRDRELEQRQHTARINKGIDWSTCLVPGCGRELKLWGRLQHWDTSWRDHTVALPLCFDHLIVAAAQADRNRNDPLMIAGAADFLERREAKTKTVSEERQKAFLAKTDGHIYFIRHNGLIKVGWSRTVYERLHSYGPDIQVLVVYEATRHDETNLHRQLAPARARGREDIPDTWSKPKQVVGGKRIVGRRT